MKPLVLAMILLTTLARSVEATTISWSGDGKVSGRMMFEDSDVPWFFSIDDIPDRCTFRSGYMVGDNMIGNNSFAYHQQPGSFDLAEMKLTSPVIFDSGGQDYLSLFVDRSRIYGAFNSGSNPVFTGVHTFFYEPIVYTVVPEPETWLLVILGAAIVVLLWRTK